MIDFHMLIAHILENWFMFLSGIGVIIWSVIALIIGYEIIQGKD
jgi:membrane protein DedA with SNARE-associated domain